MSGYSARMRKTASTAPTHSKATNAGTDEGAMPANVSVNARPTVTAGFAKLVDDVKKYAAPMYAPTANGAALRRPDRTTPKITNSRPSVATTSPSQIPPDDRVVPDHVTASRPTITLATTQPTIAPSTC